MKQLLDCLPAIIFFIFFKIYDIYVATAALIVASILQIAFDRLVLGKFNKMHNWLFLILLLFGSLTIAFQDPVFLKWKVTITQSILGTVLLVSQYVYKKPLIGMLFKNLNIEIPQKVVNRANLAWVGFFFFIAVLNLFIAFWLPQFMEDQDKALDYWVNFKVWGIMCLSAVVVIYTGMLVSPYINEQDLQTILKKKDGSSQNEENRQ